MPQLQNNKNKNNSGGSILELLLSQAGNPNDIRNSIGQATTQGLSKAGVENYDPMNPSGAYQQGVIKALKKMGEQHVAEAVQSGMSPIDIQNDPIMNQQPPMSMADPQTILQSLIGMAGQGQPQQPQQTTGQPLQPQGQPQPDLSRLGPATTPMGKFLESMGFGVGTKKEILENMLLQQKAMGSTPEQQYIESQTALNKQEFSGEKPLQAGEREKLYITDLQKIAEELSKKGNPDALTPEASAKFNLMIDGDKAIQQVANLLQSDPGVVWSAPSFLKSQKGRQYESAVKRMIRNKLRLESGATIGDKEVNEEYGKYRIGKTDYQETIRTKLNSLYEFYQGSLNVADPTGVHRRRAGGSYMGSSTWSDEKESRYQELLKKRGN